MIIIYSLPTLFLLTFSPLSTPLSKTLLSLSLSDFFNLSQPQFSSICFFLLLPKFQPAKIS